MKIQTKTEYGADVIFSFVSRHKNLIYSILVILILVASFFTRSGYLDEPLLNAHYFRQTQTATVAKNYYLDGIDLFHPKLDIFGVGEKQILVLEFPLYQAIVAIFSHVFGYSDRIGRLVSIFFGLSSGYVLLLLVNKITKRKIFGLISLVFFMFSPLNIFFQQSFMIESTVIALQIFSLFTWWKFSEKGRNSWLLMSIVVTAAAFLQKSVYAPFVILPILAITYKKLRETWEFRSKFIFGMISCLLILFLWQRYADNTNEIHGHTFFTSSNQGLFLWNFGTIKERLEFGIWIGRLRLIQNDITKIISPFFLVGIIKLIKDRSKGYLIWICWLVSMIIYYLLFFRIQSHDYYFMPIIPIICIFASYGLVYIFSINVFGKINWKYLSIYRYILIALLLIFYMYKGYLNSRPFFYIDYNMQNKLELMKKSMNKTGSVLFVIPNYDWNSVYSYYTGKKGLIIGASDYTSQQINNLKKQGYRYIVLDGVKDIFSVNPGVNNIHMLFKSTLDTQDVKIYDITSLL